MSLKDGQPCFSYGYLGSLSVSMVCSISVRFRSVKSGPLFLHRSSSSKQSRRIVSKIYILDARVLPIAMAPSRAVVERDSTPDASSQTRFERGPAAPNGLPTLVSSAVANEAVSGRCNYCWLFNLDASLHRKRVAGIAPWLLLLRRYSTYGSTEYSVKFGTGDSANRSAALRGMLHAVQETPCATFPCGLGVVHLPGADPCIRSTGP